LRQRHFVAIALFVVKSGLLKDLYRVSALLIWNAVPGASSYTLEIERTQGNTPWKITQVVQTNSFLVTGLNPNTRYKFKVRTNCAGSNHSDWTQWCKFKTILNVTGGSDDSSSKSAVSDDRSGV
jgi:Fibronectin type III domain